MPIFNSSGLGASAGRQRPKAPQRHGGSATQALGFGCKHQSFNQTCACTTSKKILAPLDVLVACAQPLDCFPKALRPCPIGQLASWLMRADQQMYIFAFQIAVQRPGQKASSSELPHVRVSLLFSVSVAKLRCISLFSNTHQVKERLSCYGFKRASQEVLAAAAASACCSVHAELLQSPQP